MSTELSFQYFAHRAVQSRTARDGATDPCAALIHADLASRYDRLASGPAVEGKPDPASSEQPSKLLSERADPPARSRADPVPGGGARPSSVQDRTKIAQAVQLSDHVGL